MKRLLVVLLLVPGGLLLLLVALALRARSKLAAAKVHADLGVLIWSRIWTLVYGVPWSLHLSILGNEGASVATAAGKYPLGDKGSSRGPALGPGQVLRARYERLLSRGRRRTFAAGDWDDAGRDTYTPFAPWTRALVGAAPVAAYELASNTRGSVWASVVILREAMDETGGDLREAARRYNGFGAAADQYATRVVDRMGVIS